jgi:hypothetical protein
MHPLLTFRTSSTVCEGGRDEGGDDAPASARMRLSRTFT